MDNNPFINKGYEPADDNLKEALSSTYSYYNRLMKNVKNFSSKWSFYNKGGWLLKVFDKKKALFYLIPDAGQFLISLTIREKEKEIFLKDEELIFLQDKLNEAKKYSEGYAMQFPVTGENSFTECMMFLDKLIPLRKRG